MSFGHDRSWLSPLMPGDPRAVELPGLSVADLIDRIDRDLAPLLVVGHRGVGKTTLLQALRAALIEERGRFCVFIDLAAIRPLHPERVLYDIAVETVQAWVHGGPEQQPSPFLVQDLRASDPSFPQGQGRTLSPADIARAAWDELTGAAGLVDRLPLIIDGLDRVEPTTARAITRALLELTGRADLVVTASPQLAYGPENIQVLDDWRPIPFGPIDPLDPESRAALVRIAIAHGGPEIAPVAESLVLHSGGILRDLVGLVHDAGSYADDVVDPAALASACADRAERLRRLLRAGDLAALRASDGTSGTEVPADRKVRLLECGLLLELGSGPAARVRPHPLLRPFLAEPTAPPAPDPSLISPTSSSSEAP